MAEKKIHDKTIENYYNILKDTDTVFGKPQIFNVPLMGGKCVVFGPSATGDHVYIYKLGNCEPGVSYSQTLQFFDEPREQLISLMEEAEKGLIKGSNTLTRAMYGQVLISKLYDVLDGDKTEFEPVPDDLGVLFGIEKLSDGREGFIFEDLEKKPVIIISGNTAEGLKFDLPSGETVFEVKAEDGVCIIRKNGCEFARFVKGKREPSLKTADGTITVADLHDIIGKSMLLYLDDEIIGTVCPDLNAGFIDIISHAHAIHVRRPEHTALIALMSVLLTGIVK